VPMSLFVDKTLNILYSNSNLSNYLHIPVGNFSPNLTRMTSAKLTALLRNGIRKSIELDKPFLLKQIPWSTGKKELILDLKFYHFKSELDEDIFLIEFIEKKKPSQSVEERFKDSENFTNQRISDLEQELKISRFDLQNAVEELESSNEELQSSNEELLAANEELQSANEELQSVNEELYTVNSEIQEKNKQLENLNNDVNNLLSSTQIGTIFLDRELNIRKFTPAISNIFNLEDSDIGRPLHNFTSGIEKGELSEIFDKTLEVIKSLQVFEKEIAIGRQESYLVRITPFVTVDNKIEGAVITFIETTKLRESIQKIKVIDTKLSLAMEMGKLAWWEWNYKTKHLDYSENKASILGYTVNEIGHAIEGFTEKIHPDDYEKAMQAMRSHLTGKADIYEVEYRIRCKNGKYVWLFDRGGVVEKDKNGNILKLAGIVIDITNRIVLEKKLQNAIEKAELANIYKDNFLANMSHEIRTPMNGIIGFADLLRKDNLTKERKDRYVDLINNNCQSLLKLIDDIVDLSKIEVGQLNLHYEKFDPNELLNELYEFFTDYKKMINKDHLEIILNLPAKQILINSDRDRIKQVMINLINNSFKFTREGEIEFGYVKQTGFIEFYVRDTGSGMHKKDLNQIFERFHQLNNDVTHESSGTGLGLAISKGIALALGGDLKVKSKFNEGSTFFFTIENKPG